jgi:hypothetical protein
MNGRAGGKVVKLEDDQEPAWRLGWNLQPVAMIEGYEHLDAPDATVFRVDLPNMDAAYQFKAELHRWLGAMMLEGKITVHIALAGGESEANHASE